MPAMKLPKPISFLTLKMSFPEYYEITWPEVEWKWQFGENVYGFQDKGIPSVCMTLYNNKLDHEMCVSWELNAKKNYI